ncbi:uncharacterized protein LOC113353952 [Papaver somniferum]|uniref:uncharacterized protein LOC113353952 n=1 Tax=Papaver somniferum TaxID=3469 RepID=UPI000E70262E|nr:uncharacterized protein LOC113353952 [Papaver somniferum]
MRMHIDANIKESLPKPKNAKDFMEIVKERFKTADKSLAGKLMTDYTTMKYTGVRSMHQHVIEMRIIAAKLTEMKLIVDENFLVQFILNSLPPQYAPFQVHYNTIKEKWTANELGNMLVQEEARINQQGLNQAHFVNRGVNNKLKPAKGNKGAPQNNSGQPEKKKEKQYDNKCRFCKKPGHFQKDCSKSQKWFEKKGIPFKPTHKPE